jgi:exodeoxyribonuclease VII small subunit
LQDLELFKMTKKLFSYQQAISEIEGIIKRLENEEINLDSLSDNVRRASELIMNCKQNLKSSEEEIEKIIKNIQTDQEV